jgi:Rps23 Pro-64 3,4-dihydroxylase Tpa1-like proline 4-hydroxylase
VKAHHIAPHDDRSILEIENDDGKKVKYSRDIALIYYMTKDWTKEMGGTLVDMESNRKYVPEFNSLVAFTVPRWHEVQALITDRPRYSIFGWFLSKGVLYDILQEGEQDKMLS